MINSPWHLGPGKLVRARTAPEAIGAKGIHGFAGWRVRAAWRVSFRFYVASALLPRVVGSHTCCFTILHRDTILDAPASLAKFGRDEYPCGFERNGYASEGDSNRAKDAPAHFSFPNIPEILDRGRA